MNRQEWEKAMVASDKKQLETQAKIDNDPRMQEANLVLKQASEKANLVRQQLNREYGMDELIAEQYSLIDQMPPRE